MGPHIVFQRWAFDPGSHQGRTTLAHELIHVVQQRNGPVDGTLVAGGIRVSDPSDRFEREAATAAERAMAAPAAAARSTASAQVKCQAGEENRAIFNLQRDVPLGSGLSRPDDDAERENVVTGCAQRWGPDTTCSLFGFEQGQCCNTFPAAVEDWAIANGLDGAASCHADHKREIAFIVFDDKGTQHIVSVLCSDTLSEEKYNAKPIPPNACGDAKFKEDKKREVIEMSKKAMQTVSNQTGTQIPVSVSYSGRKEDLCQHIGGAPKSFPKPSECLTPKGCRPSQDAPSR
jgi:hypothetical protein